MSTLPEIRRRLALETLKAAASAQLIIDEPIAATPITDTDRVVRMDASYALARARETLIGAVALINTDAGRPVVMPDVRPLLAVGGVG